MSDEHSKFSASNFEADTLCPGRRVMQAGLPDRGSKYATEGTGAHTLLEHCMTHHKRADSDIGTRVDAGPHETVEVTKDMAEAVQTAIDAIHEIVGDGMLLTEQRVNYSSYLGVAPEEGWGTSDIIAARGDELQVHDYKHGMGVEVDADDNPQMKLYGLGALAACQGILGDFETVRLVIHQPRIKSAPSEWVTTVAELEAWGRGEAARSVQEQLGAERMRSSQAFGTQGEWETIYLRPNEKSCKFCKAKPTCPALRTEALQTVYGTRTSVATPEEFDEALPLSPRGNLDPEYGSAWLSAAMAKADLIEDWLKAVRAEVEARLLEGMTVPGYKLVEGRLGDRAWADKDAAEAALKAMRLKHDQMYDYKLISPTSAEKLAPKFDKTGAVKPGQDPTPIGERQWKKLQAQITRAPGKKHVAPVSDPRPALDITPPTDDFDVVPDSQPVADLADFA